MKLSVDWKDTTTFIETLYADGVDHDHVQSEELQTIYQ